MLRESISRQRGARRDVPLYEMVDSVIRKRLVENDYPPGSMLPSEIQLAKELGVSQGTVRRALDGLVAEGLVNRRQGLGTFVSEMEDRRSLFLFFNMIAHDGRQEMPAARLISAEDGQASEEEARKLAVTPGAPVRRLLRIRLFRETPTIVERVVVSESVLPGLGRDSTPPDHLFRHYETRYKVTVVEADESLRAVAATAEEARLLEIAPGAPLLEVDRVAFAIGRRPVEWRVSRCDTSGHDYHIDRG
ncbi:GntR family transcriptional regulator [Nitratireductor luteus]|uniref:GntR family transcriptional regulator n=1 Tax=Nitratireductor luteus TaxID=2976980 RepID=UPI002240BCC8